MKNLRYLAMFVAFLHGNPRAVPGHNEIVVAGVPLVWLVDPARRTVTIYRSLTETQQLTSEDTITAEPILPGFSVPVSRFF